MKIIFTLLAFVFLGCSSVITGVASLASDIVIAAVTLPIKAIYKIGKSTLSVANSNSNSSITKDASKALEKQNYKKAYELYVKACNEDEPMLCALANYSYKKCELLNDGCKNNEVLQNNAVKYLSAKLFLDEANELKGNEKKAYINIACEYDLSISKECE